ncbi:hypothetical protein [Botrimarina sp.]|uniref:hypothetical protein n=1 Tax=Botrimarina sp. TaxID=2795802 RepID=UPI0032EC2D15
MDRRRRRHPTRRSALVAALLAACAVGIDARGQAEPRRLPPPGPNDVGALITADAEPTAHAPEEVPAPAVIRLPPVQPIGPIEPAPPAPPPWPLAIETEPPEPIGAAPAAGPLAGLGEIAFCDYCGDACSSGGCCGDCAGATRGGRFARAVYRGLCCPDPCYRPQWRPRADAAFFTAAARPVNQQRFRWDWAEDLFQADRAEYFWARTGAGGRGPNVQPPRVDYDELRHYAEVAHGSFGAWVDYSYRSLDYAGGHEAGFGDLTIGTKTLLFDTELVQMAFQMQTHVPAGSVGKGLGVGHTSLEPGLIFGLNLSPGSYLQVELNEWIPIAGDPTYAGAIFRYNAAYNRVLARPHPGVPVIGSLELAGWRFQDGAYTASDGAGGVVTRRASGDNYVHAAAGFRVFFCDRADIGVSYLAPMTSDSWADTLVRTELRFRY